MRPAPPPTAAAVGRDPERRVATVVGLAVAPVKSLGLQHPEAIELRSHGAVGDRSLFLVDRARPLLYNGIRRGRLVQVSARLRGRDGWLTLVFPDGRRVEATSARLGDRLTVSICHREVSARVVGGPFAAALSDHCGHDVLLVRPDRAGGALDVHPVTLASVATAAQLAERAGDPRLADARRYRMLITLGGCGPGDEEGWSGRRLRVGGAVLRILGPVPRCGVTQQDPATGAYQVPTLRHLADHRGLGADGRSVHLGMYAEVAAAGRVRVGDPAEPVAETG